MHYLLHYFSIFTSLCIPKLLKKVEYYVLYTREQTCFPKLFVLYHDIAALPLLSFELACMLHGRAEAWNLFFGNGIFIKLNQIRYVVEAEIFFSFGI